MNSPSNQPEFRPAPTPKFYRALAAVAGPLEKILGITCRDFTQLASARIDRTLTGGERVRYVLHRLACGLCRKQERRVRQLNQLAGDVLKRAADEPAVKLDDEVRSRIRERVLRELKNGPDSKA
jgi:hypothetical protein